jgi:hypothetical protein
VPQLEFEFKEFLDEIKAIKDVAKNFLDRSANDVLDRLERNLTTIRTARRGTDGLRWEIPLSSPLKTRISQGKYEKGGREGKHDVFGEITSIWIISPSDPKATSRTLAKTFSVTGKASVRIRLVEPNSVSGDRELAMWRVELGDVHAPGCYFHIQVLGEDGRIEPPFPHSLSVPRLPALVFTPMAALEFVIAELFQDEWRQQVARETPAIQMWRSIQQKRFRSLFAWKYELVKTHSGTPWTAIKFTNPQPKLFLEQEKLPRVLH